MTSRKIHLVLLIAFMCRRVLPETATTIKAVTSPKQHVDDVTDEDDDAIDEDDEDESAEIDDDGRVYRFKNPRNSPSPLCPRNEEQATLFGQKCLRKCSADDDCKSKKKKCLCDGFCGMSCIKPDRECPELPEISLGTVTVTGRLFGDRATYSCQHGYHVVGLATRTCQADGNWAGNAPSCKQNIYCLSPPTTENARHNALPEQTTFDLDSTIQYYCNVGYDTNGFTRAKCLADDGKASWFGPDISCEPKSCGPPEDISHGWHSGDCYTYGCRVQYHCAEGFELVGKGDRFCESDGKWSPRELPTCVLVTAVVCAAPEQPRNGRAVYTSCAYNSVVSYECNYGYTLVGDATRRCGADKKWTGSTPVCKEINCGHPGRLWNGWLENIEAGTGLGASIIFRCHEGMKLDGHTSTVCQIDGKWRYPLPHCLAPCVVPHVQQGRVYLASQENETDARPTILHQTVVQHGEELGVECQPQYEFLSNLTPVTCNNGTWTHIPRCEPARCKHMPKSPRNGVVIAPKTDHGMKAIFKCKDGYTLKGIYYVECSFGNWTGQNPYCEEVYCPFPGYVDNGKVLLVGNMGLYDYRPYVRKVTNNKQIMYDCDKGYVLAEGPPGATCIGGRWSPKQLPRCLPGQHPRIRLNRRRRRSTALMRSMFARRYVKNIVDDVHGRYKRSYASKRHRVNEVRARRLFVRYLSATGARRKRDLLRVFDPNVNLPERIRLGGPSLDYGALMELNHSQRRRPAERLRHVARDAPGIVESVEAPQTNRSEANDDWRPVERVASVDVVDVVDDDDDDDNRLIKDAVPVVAVFHKIPLNHQPYVDYEKGYQPIHHSCLEDQQFLIHKQPFLSTDIIKIKSNVKTDGKQPPKGRKTRSTYPDGYKSRYGDGFTEPTRDVDGDRSSFLERGRDRWPNHYRRGGDDEDDDDAAATTTPEPNASTNRTARIAKAKRSMLSRSNTHTNQLLNRNQNSGTSVRRNNNRNQNVDVDMPPLYTNQTGGGGGGGNETTTRGKKRPKGPCELISSEPFVNVEIVKYGRDPNVSYSSGTVVKVACGKGYGLNLNPNATAKCVRGLWKPAKPECRILPCHVPNTSNGFYRLSTTETSSSGGQTQSISLDTLTVYLNDTVDIENGVVVKFSCQHGYNVKGPSNLKCWHGEWAVSSMPDCIPAPCQLPQIPNGQYMSGYRAGLTIGNGSFVTYQCDTFYRKANAQPIQCLLGELLPRVPSCRLSRPTLTGAGILSGINKTGIDDIQYRAGSDISQNGGLDLAEKMNSKSCGRPARVQGALLFKDGEQMTEENDEEAYTEGTEITFDCSISHVGEKTTWRIICEDGNWIGRSLNCDIEEPSLVSTTIYNNATCTFRNNEPNVVSFYNDQEIREDVVDFPPGAVLTSRCTDIGKYAMIGSTVRRCLGTEWDNPKPACFGLNQENDYEMAKPPTILFRHQLGPIAQSNAGKLIVYPGTILHMECLWIRRFGNPKWNVSHSYRKYPEGWSTDPGRDSQLEYRLSIFHASKDDSGVFTCITPARQSHAVEIEVKAVHCPQIPQRRGLTVHNKNTKMNTKLRLGCTNSNSLIGSPEITCLPSGNWSHPFPICESVECGDVFPPSHLNSTLYADLEITSPHLRVVIVSREVGGRAVFSCTPGFGLRGPGETVCLSSGEWALPFPTCVEVQCDPPGIPENGYIQGTPPYKAGDIVQFNCNPDYMMEGQPIIACQDNSRWSGSLPKCIQACSYPGTTISGRMSSVKFYYKIGETVVFRCDDGHILRGVAMLRCLKHGKWSNAIPTCVSREHVLAHSLSSGGGNARSSNARATNKEPIDEKPTTRRRRRKRRHVSSEIDPRRYAERSHRNAAPKRPSHVSKRDRRHVDEEWTYAIPDRLGVARIRGEFRPDLSAEALLERLRGPYDVGSTSDDASDDATPTKYRKELVLV